MRPLHRVRDAKIASNEGIAAQAPADVSRLASGVLWSVAALAAAGCGSSGSSGSSATKTTATTPRASGGFRVNTIPRFAAPSASSPVRSGLVEVAYRNIAISPDTLRVKVGATIRWRNYDSFEHNVTSRGGPQRFASANLREGATFQIRVTRPGLIHYLCTIHPASMNGSIEVLR